MEAIDSSQCTNESVASRARGAEDGLRPRAGGTGPLDSQAAAGAVSLDGQFALARPDNRASGLPGVALGPLTRQRPPQGQGGGCRQPTLLHPQDGLGMPGLVSHLKGPSREGVGAFAR
jgi:hypothetical protein